MDKRILKPLGSNVALQSQVSNQRPRSAKPLNNGIPIFTHERAEERATKKTNVLLIKNHFLNFVKSFLLKGKPN